MRKSWEDQLVLRFNPNPAGLTEERATKQLGCRAAEAARRGRWAGENESKHTEHDLFVICGFFNNLFDIKQKLKLFRVILSILSSCLKIRLLVPCWCRLEVTHADPNVRRGPWFGQNLCIVSHVVFIKLSKTNTGSNLAQL